MKAGTKTKHGTETSFTHFVTARYKYYPHNEQMHG